MFTPIVRTHAFEVVSKQTILYQTILNFYWDEPNKIACIKRIREEFKPIGLKDAKEIYEAVAKEHHEKGGIHG